MLLWYPLGLTFDNIIDPTPLFTDYMRYLIAVSFWFRGQYNISVVKHS